MVFRLTDDGMAARDNQIELQLTDGNANAMAELTFTASTSEDYVSHHFAMTGDCCETRTA
jgi:hypothetical protein